MPGRVPTRDPDAVGTRQRRKLTSPHILDGDDGCLACIGSIHTGCRHRAALHSSTPAVPREYLQGCLVGRRGAAISVGPDWRISDGAGGQMTYNLTEKSIKPALDAPTSHPSASTSDVLVFQIPQPCRMYRTHTNETPRLSRVRHDVCSTTAGKAQHGPTTPGPVRFGPPEPRDRLNRRRTGSAS